MPRQPTSTPDPPSNPLLVLLSEKGMSPTKGDLEALGRALATVIGRDRPYSYPHLHGVAKGHLQPGAELEAAIDALLAAEDGMDPNLAGSVQVELMVPRGIADDIQWAYCPIEPKFCSDPKEVGCTNRFVPNVSWRSACYTCSPIRRKD